MRFLSRAIGDIRRSEAGLCRDRVPPRRSGCFIRNQRPRRGICECAPRCGTVAMHSAVDQSGTSRTGHFGWRPAVALVAGTPAPRGNFGQEKGPGENPGPCMWWWDGTPHQTTIESTESKRCGLLRTRANRIEKAADTPCGRGRSNRFFALIGCRCAASTSFAFRSQFNSRNRNRTRVPQSLSAGRTKLHDHCHAGPACRAQPVRGNAA